MRMLTAGPLRVRALGGSDRRGGGDGPAVVLLHGYGVPGNDLVLLPRKVKAGEGVRWFFPEGPLETDGDGGMARAWYAIDRDGIAVRIAAGLSPYPLSAEVPPGMLEAAAQLAACLAALHREHGLAPERTVIGGFSQGAVMATELVLQHRPWFVGAALLSGRLLDPTRMAAPLREAGARLHVFQSHGSEDAIIPLANGLALRDVVQSHGAHVEWLPYPGGHAITSEVHEALGAFCRRRLFPPPVDPKTSCDCSASS